MSTEQLLARARAHLTEEPDREMRAELNSVVERVVAGESTALADLEDRFDGSLSFGTAGLRGQLGAGSNRMNRLVVMRAAWGLGQHLIADAREHGLEPIRPIIVAFDGRRYSRQFAEDTASVLCGLGLPVRIFDDVAATPLLAFAIPALDASAGVMVTASHNPSKDNGYKVYWSNGAQIVAPHDIEIASFIDRAPSLAELSRPGPHEAALAGLRRAVGDEVERAYLDGVRSGSVHPEAGRTQPLSIVYTAMHGVGHHLVVRALREAGFEAVASVSSQAEPDGAFPTVGFPNPEEEGALDRALELANSLGADLVLANDPDADRLAVAVVHGEPDARRFRVLSGNEVGVLLGADLLQHADTGGRKKLAITTIVSSTMLGRIASDMDASYAETLTGFKWLATTAIARARDHDEAFVFGYEEALGYSAGPLVRDKDGVSAAVRLAELAAWLKASGKSLLDELDRLALCHGQSSGLQWSVRLEGRAGRERIDALMSRLREHPLESLEGSAVVRRYDVLARSAWSSDGELSPWDLPVADVLVFFDAQGTRLVVRPSGTEPKIKFYLESVGWPTRRSEIEEVGLELDARLARIRDVLMAHLSLA